jgi:hypothetical protein
MIRGEVDGQSGDVVGAALDFTGVHAAAQVKTSVVCVGDHAPRAAHALGWAGEQRQHPVTGRLDHQATVIADRGAALGQVAAERVSPRAISGAGGVLCRVDEIGEHHSRQDTIGDRCRRSAGDEFLNHIRDDSTSNA